MSDNAGPQKMPEHSFYGALRLDYDSAERADVAKQNFCVQARAWYIDATFRCEACETEFVFSAKEQQFWYEEQRFYVDSMPRKCPECRKQDRKIELLRQQYDSLISSTQPNYSGALEKPPNLDIERIVPARGSRVTIRSWDKENTVV